ncbi:MAG TPA: zinc ribbon domain-containing protein [Candidatus Polarisedimenticolia bacterium]|nr:zinc ribbon domain-containing protein [Candidatus Polarisedimenticolia bacterium]
MRVIVQCPSCKRQTDSGDLPVDGKFHCACGEVLRVPQVLAKDAAVVRCSSCGGPRTADEAACGFCGADFTVHERDLDTICPSCMARITSSARFCHNCGTRIAVEGKSGTPTDYPCPACGAEHRLDSRTLGQPPAAITECRTCGGLWVGCETFKLLTERVQAQGPTPAGLPGEAERPAQARSAAQRGPLYRYCPQCHQMMARRNYAKWSGVIIDSCHEHGIWFDEGELYALLQWIRRGGQREAAALERQETERAERRLQMAKMPSRIDRKAGGAGGSGFTLPEGEDSSLLMDLLGTLFGRR